MPTQLALPGFDLSPPPLHTLYLALLPDRAAAARIGPLARTLHAELGLPGRPRAPACPHVSLFGLRLAAPPPAALVAAFSEAAAGIAVAPVELELDRVMTFRGPSGRLPVVLCGESAVAALRPLHAALAARLERLGLVRRRGLSPHLTPLHAPRPLPRRTVAAIAWRVGGLVLVHGHGRDYRHDLLGRWPLGGAQAGVGITSQSSRGRARKARRVEPRTMPATSSGAVW